MGVSKLNEVFDSNFIPITGGILSKDEVVEAVVQMDGGDATYK